MSGKGGLGSIPLLPQNLLAVKDENPKVFTARIVYVLIYLILLGLFIAYAVIALIEFLDAQKNPATNTNVKGQNKMTYPVLAVCPYYTDYKIKRDDINIGNCGSLEREDDPQCGGKKKGEKKSKDLQKKLANCKENKVEQSFPTFFGSDPYDFDTYGCVFLNLDKPYDEKIENSIISDETCNGKKPTGGNGKKSKSDDIETSFAKGVGYPDRYQFSITGDYDFETFSLTVKPSIEDFDIRTAEDAGNGFPEGTHIAVFLKKTTFKCESCEDDQLETYYNTTINILSLQASNNEKQSKTRVEVYFDGLTTTEYEEVITTTTLDYLGNFAGMLGTLLGFAVINYLDRLLCYFIIGHGGMASVWDDYNQ